LVNLAFIPSVSSSDPFFPLRTITITPAITIKRRIPPIIPKIIQSIDEPPAFKWSIQATSLSGNISIELSARIIYPYVTVSKSDVFVPVETLALGHVIVPAGIPVSSYEILQAKVAFVIFKHDDVAPANVNVTEVFVASASSIDE